MTLVAMFVDVSAFQGAIDWTAYKQWSAQWDGIARVAMKATEGVGFTDPQFYANRQGAIEAGVDVLYLYHFARPDLNNSPVAEALSMLDVVGTAIRESDQIILDIEVNATQNIAEWVYEWLSSMKGYYLGKLPGLYASLSYIQQRLQDSRLSAFPLWYANWQYTPDERPPVPAPWSSYEFVQYTDRATNIPGIAGTVDANIFLGGNTPVQQYGPDSSDFGAYFTATDAEHWTCKQTGAVVQFGNLNLYRTLSLGLLPIIGLPLENEQPHNETDGYYWSSQQFERATMVYDPEHRFDSVPGMGTSYLSHINPPTTQVIEKIPDAIVADIKLLPGPVARLIAAAGL